MKQESFSDMEYRCRKKKTKREEFLEIMDEIDPAALSASVGGEGHRQAVVRPVRR